MNSDISKFRLNHIENNQGCVQGVVLEIVSESI